jgi:hypothetical protein
MKYFRIGNVNFAEMELPDNASFPDYVVLTKAQYDFAVANPTATKAEIIAKKLTVHVPTLAELKQAKIDALNTHFYAIFVNGYYDSTTKWTLFCGESNVSDYATLKNAIMDMADNTVVKIGTMTGWQTSTKAVVYPLLTRYSAYMLPLTTGYMEIKSYIDYAPDKESLDLINW